MTRLPTALPIIQLRAGATLRRMHHHSSPCGQRTELVYGPWSGFVHAAAASGSTRPGESFDAGFVDRVGDVVRIVAFDAAVQPHDTPQQLQRVLASLVWRSALPQSLLRAWVRANTWLHDPQRRPHQHNAMVSAAGVDLDVASGVVTATIAGDGEVWVRRAGSWTQATAITDPLTPAARAAYGAGIRGLVSEDARWQVQYDLLDSPDAWVRTPLGCFATPKFATLTILDVDAVVVSSDGARLTPAAVADLDAWLNVGLHRVPATHPHPHPHGDVWVGMLQRQPTGVREGG